MKLTLIDISSIGTIIEKSKMKPVAVFYGDFNILNSFFEKTISFNKEVRTVIYPDSSLVFLMVKLFKGIFSKRIVSTDLIYDTLNYANNNRLKMYFFGDNLETLEAVKRKLEKDYQQIIVTGFQNGYDYETNKVVNEINISKPDIVLIGLGAIRQEKWLFENAERINCGTLITAGGFFRYFGNGKFRAPKIFRIFYLEWLFKLALEFKRVAERYFYIAPKFVLRFIKMRNEIDIGKFDENSLF
ncbi:MAG: WecB/TagA/CpsF family glycosyltransferase [Ignavibacteriaceae bacterium]|nr:WecB/TagA/CpsF family glycosyltransferase [Ignavibacteriaceae bacterium]